MISKRINKTIRAVLLGVLLAISGTLANLHAQTPQWSLRGGLLLSNVGGQDAVNNNIKAGLHLGILAGLPIIDRYTIETGLTYSIKGSKSSIDPYQTFSLHYIDLPVLARVNLIGDLDFLAGPQISYLILSRVITEINGGSLIDKSMEGTRRLDLGLYGGLAYTWQDKVSLNAGYEWGLLSLDKQGNFNIFNRLIKLSLGYHF